LFVAGFEVSGIIDEICPSVIDCSLAVGDRIVVYPTNDEELTETGSVNVELLSQQEKGDTVMRLITVIVQLPSLSSVWYSKRN